MPKHNTLRFGPHAWKRWGSLSVSMALGEWISVQSSRELYERQIMIERNELAQAPQEEENELALIYQAKGLPEDVARDLARRLVADPATALDTLAREELGIDPGELGGSAWEAVLTSFCLFAIGAIVPVAPFVFLVGWTAISVSLVLSALGLFGIGAASTLLTGRSVWFSGMGRVIVGLAADREAEYRATDIQSFIHKRHIYYRRA